MASSLERLTAEPQLAGLFLDFDGVLAPIVERPDDAYRRSSEFLAWHESYEEILRADANAREAFQAVRTHPAPVVKDRRAAMAL